MTNKIQTTLTIALTAAVTVLLVDRIIEPAYAQDCASSYDVQTSSYEIEQAVSKARRDIMDCLLVLNNDTLANAYCRS